jgi:transposase
MPRTAATKPKTLTRPDACEARRLRAAELFAQGRRPAEVAELVGVSYEAARRWQARWRKGGVQALRRRQAGGRPPKLSDEQVRQIEQALLDGATANGFDNDLWTLDRVAQVAERVSGVRLAPASVWRLLHRRLGWSVQRPKARPRSAMRRRSPAGWPMSGRGFKRGRRQTRMASLFRRVGHLAAAGHPPDLVAAWGDADPAASLQLEAGLDGRRAGLSRQRRRPRPAAVLSRAKGQLQHPDADRRAGTARWLLRRPAGGAAVGWAGGALEPRHASLAGHPAGLAVGGTAAGLRA